MNTEQLDALARRVQDGDQEAFEDLVRAILLDLRVFIAARAPSLQVVEEVLQATLVTCYESIHTYKPHGTLLPWLKGIARNRLREEFRAQERYHTIEGNALEAMVLAGSARAVERLGEEDLREDELDRLRACLDRLGSRARTLLERRHAQGVSLQRLAQQFKQSVEKLANTLKSVRRAVRRCVNESRVTT